MVGESNQNVFLIQIDASSFAEFEIFEVEISRFDLYYDSMQIYKITNYTLICIIRDTHSMSLHLD